MSRIVRLKKRFFFVFFGFAWYVRSFLVCGLKLFFLRLGGGRIATEKKLVKLISNSLPKSTVCHVLGSGWSVLESSRLIGKDDFVIGFNFSGILDVKNDIYFVEIGSFKEARVSDAQLSLVKEKVAADGTRVFYKNLWSKTSCFRYLWKNWIGVVYFVPDYLLYVQAENLEASIRRSLSEPGIFIPQVVSTAFTAVHIARQAGFKIIVLHGVDFYGPHFFDLMDNSDIDKYRPWDKKNSHAVGYHPTSMDETGMPKVLSIVKKIFSEKGVDVLAATNKSPSSKVLGAYEDKVF